MSFYGRRFRFALLVAAGVLLTACHADIAYKFDVHSAKLVTVTVHESIDDQLYAMARSQSTNNDPFGMDAAQRAGWAISRTVDDEGNHVLDATKTLGVADLAALKYSGSPMPGPGGKSLDINPTRFTTTRGLFIDTHTMNVTVPPIMPPSQTDSSNPFAAEGTAVVASMIGLHLELRTPWTLVSTNGEKLPDGFVRWNLAFQSPTDLVYTVKTPDVPHIAVAIAAAVVLLVLVALVAMRSISMRQKQVDLV